MNGPMTLLRGAVVAAGLIFLACVHPEEISNEEFLAMAAAEPGAVTRPSGLIYLELQAGTGAQPLSSSDRVDVDYVGRLKDGELFDQGNIIIRLNEVIACWTEGVALMKEGGRAKLTCPPGLAYGASGQGPIPGNSVLQFEVTLNDVVGR